jgi:hypothetical protein
VVVLRLKNVGIVEMGIVGLMDVARWRDDDALRGEGYCMYFLS